MPGIEFFQTVMGRAFYEGTMPRVAKALERIADALEKQNAKDEPHFTPAELHERCKEMMLRPNPASTSKCIHGVPLSKDCEACEE